MDKTTGARLEDFISRKIGKMIIFIVPFFLGTYGIYALREGNIFDAAYKAVQLYVMEFSVDSEKLNLATELARWLAPLATAAAILNILYSLVEGFRIRIKTKNPEIIALHGDGANMDLVLKKLGKKAFTSKNKMAMRARRHVLMFEDDYDMYHFIDEHGEEMMHGDNKEIFLCSEKILRGNYENKNVVVCNVAENCARNYWETYPIEKRNEKILILGFENYGQKILSQALLKNVLALDSRIEYHIAGDYQEYLSKHIKLHKVACLKRIRADGKEENIMPCDPICTNHDCIYFYDMEWYEILRRGILFDRIIIVNDIDATNIDLLNELKTYYVCSSCYIKFSDVKILGSLWNIKNEKIIPFGIKSELYEPEMILKEALFDHAKMIHARYYASWQCDGVCDGGKCGNRKDGRPKHLRRCICCERLLDDWSKLSTFLRYSNVAQADHIPEKLRLLLGENVDKNSPGVGVRAVEAYKRLGREEKRILWEIEHVRWDRYHFMNNWDYADVRDNQNRKHPLLQPFSELSDKEQRKDEDAYLALDELLN